MLYFISNGATEKKNFRKEMRRESKSVTIRNQVNIKEGRNGRNREQKSMRKTENKQQNDSSPFVSSDFNIDGVTSPVKKRHGKKDQGEKGNVSSNANYKRLIQFFSTKRLKVREQKNILHRKKKTLPAKINQKKAR